MARWPNSGQTMTENATKSNNIQFAESSDIKVVYESDTMLVMEKLAHASHHDDADNNNNDVNNNEMGVVSYVRSLQKQNKINIKDDYGVCIVLTVQHQAHYYLQNHSM